MNHPKTYIGFANDHSGSMGSLRTAALKDYNANIATIKSAASAEMLDTIVSVTGFGVGGGGVERQIVNSNPHVLNAMSKWQADGMTPMYDAVGDLIQQFAAVPDFGSPDVSFLIFVTTDGDENSSTRYSRTSLAKLIEQVSADGRWTFVFRVPRGSRSGLTGLGIPSGNIQEWDTTSEGMAKSTATTAQAVRSFISAKAAGQKSSTVFYADATAVDTSKLLDVSGKVKLYVVESHENGGQIRDFILRRRTRYLKGSAFYQLTKTEPRVGPNKMIAVRDRTSGAIYAGKEARSMLGLSSVDNIRLHPGDHGNYDLFIQSESVNRKLVAGTGVLYWEEIGVPFTQEEIDRFNGTAAPVTPKPAVVVLPQVVPTTKPTPSPLKPTPKAVAPAVTSVPVAIPSPGRVRFYTAPVNAQFFTTREDARNAVKLLGLKQYDAGPQAPKGKRFYIA